jgi:hypothetical protein
MILRHHYYNTLVVFLTTTLNTCCLQLCFSKCKINHYSDNLSIRLKASNKHFVMKSLDILYFGISFALNFVLFATFYNDPKEFSSAFFAMVNGIGSAIYELVFAIANFERWALFTVDLMTQLFFLIFSFQTYVAVLTAGLVYSILHNWDESKRVTAELWKPVHNTVVFFGTILSSPEKVLMYVIIFFTIQMFPSFASAIVKSSKLNA